MKLSSVPARSTLMKYAHRLFSPWFGLQPWGGGTSLHCLKNCVHWPKWWHQVQSWAPKTSEQKKNLEVGFHGITLIQRIVLYIREECHQKAPLAFDVGTKQWWLVNFRLTRSKRQVSGMHTMLATSTHLLSHSWCQRQHTAPSQHRSDTPKGWQQ